MPPACHSKQHRLRSLQGGSGAAVEPAPASVDLLKSKDGEDGLLLEFDTEAVLTDAILDPRIRLVDHNPGAMSFDPSVRHLSRSKWHTIESWNAAHPRGGQPSEVMIRGGLSTVEFEDALVEVV